MLETLSAALALILIANGAPVLAQHVPILNKLAYALDGGLQFVDGRRVLGSSKTWLGVLAAVVATTVAAPIVGFGWLDGVSVALLAMLGDAVSSFTKRRLNIRPSGMAIGIDQIPESLLPLLYFYYHLRHIDGLSVVVGVVLFIVLELMLSRIAYQLSLRKQPY